MKTKTIFIAIGFLAVIGLLTSYFAFCSGSSKECTIERSVKDTTSNTILSVYNPSNDTILTYLTINVIDTSWVSNVNGIFGISSQKSTQGSFYLYPGDTLSYVSSKPFSGNISFNNPPLNCPFPAPTLYEFCLNNSGTVTDAQETVDISCVYGVTTIGSINLVGGGPWNSGGNDTISFIRNKSLYKNTGLKGVYPYGCTTCTGRAGMVNCSNKKKYEATNKKNICNIQRDASTRGGQVVISYIRTL